MACEFKSWGVKYHPGISHAKDLNCHNCGWAFLKFGSDQYKQIVGFSPEDPFGQSAFGIIIIECPRCFEKFWFHVTSEETIEDYIYLCPNWPK